MVSFKVTGEERALIEKIAERADREIFRPHKFQQSKMDTEMDLSATIAQGCRLDLDKLLKADEFNFQHDVLGIRRHLDRGTGKLKGCFLPRAARKEAA